MRQILILYISFMLTAGPNGKPYRINPPRFDKVFKVKGTHLPYLQQQSDLNFLSDS